MIAHACYGIVERIGMPEARITLAQCAAYLALAPKSNASYVAIEEALTDVREGRTRAVPSAIKDGNVRKAAERSAGTARGEAYAYSHDTGTQGPAGAVGGVTAQDYLGEDRRYYRPVPRGLEAQLAERLEALRGERERLRRGDRP
jgi:putative ATPase